MPFLTLNSVLSSHFGGMLRAFGIGIIPHSDVCTGLRQGVGYLKPNAGARTGHDGCFSLEGKHCHHTGMLGSSGVVVDENSILDGVGGHGDRLGGRREGRGTKEVGCIRIQTDGCEIADAFGSMSSK